MYDWIELSRLSQDASGSAFDGYLKSVLRIGQLRFAWSPPEWVVAISLCQSAGCYPPPHGILKLKTLEAMALQSLHRARSSVGA